MSSTGLGSILLYLLALIVGINFSQNLFTSSEAAVPCVCESIWSLSKNTDLQIMTLHPAGGYRITS